MKKVSTILRVLAIVLVSASFSYAQVAKDIAPAIQKQVEMNESVAPEALSSNSSYGSLPFVSYNPVYSNQFNGVKSASKQMLWDNTNIAFSSGLVSTQLSGLSAAASKANAADDFVVPYGYSWDIDSININGSLSTGTILPDSMVVEFYNDATGSPGAMFYRKAVKPVNIDSLNTAYVQTMLDLGSPVTLTTGTYWISCYAKYDTVTTLSVGRYNWGTGTLPVGNEAMLQDLTGLFGGFTWTPLSTLITTNSPLSMWFQIHGSPTITIGYTDAGIGAVNYPGGLPGMKDVEVVLHNYGTDTLTSATINYTFDGVAGTPFTWTGSILPATSSSMANVIIANENFTIGSHSIVAWTSGANGTATQDYNPLNDTASVTGSTVNSINVFPSCEDFEGATLVWQQPTTDDMDWTVNSGGTPSGTTGPTGAASGTNYIYLETSTPAAVGDVGLLEAVYDFTNLTNPYITFFYHMYGAGMGTLALDVHDGTSWTTGVWSKLGDQGDVWNFDAIDLSTYSGKSAVTLRFRGVVSDTGSTGSTFHSDMALDKVCVGPAIVDDIGVLSIIPLPALTPGNSYPVEVIVSNFGTNAVNAFDIEYTVAGGTPISTSFTTTLAPLASDTFLLNTFTAPSTWGDICVSTDLTNDTDPSNDMQCITFNTVFAWTLQFEEFLDTSGTYGAQAGIETDGTYMYVTEWSGTNFIQYDMTGTAIGAFNITGATNLRDLAFDGVYFYGSNATAGSGIYEMDFNNQALVSTIPTNVAVRAIAYDEVADGFWANNWSSDLELINRSGTTINTLTVGALGSYYGLAYDSVSDGGPYLWGLSQDNSGAELVQIEISSGTQIRNYDTYNDLNVAVGDIGGGAFTHANLITNTYTLGGLIQGKSFFGYFLDSVPVISLDGSVTSVINPGDGCGLTSIPVEVIIKNNGITDITTVDVSYSIDGGAPITETVTQTIPFQQTYSHTFATNADVSAVGAHTIEAWTTLVGDQNPTNDMSTTVVTHVAPSQVDYFMGFEAADDYSNWNMQNVGGDAGAWSVDMGSLGSAGVGSAVYNWNPDGTTPADDWLFSTCIDLDAAEDYRLDFMYLVGDAQYEEKLEVAVGTSPDAGSMSIPIVDLGAFTNTAGTLSQSWFSVPADGSYYLGFHAYSDADKWYLAIDEIGLYLATGTEDPSDGFAVKVYPNPATDVINIEVTDDQIESITVLNSLGQIVKSSITSSNQTTIDISELSNGMYFVRVETEKGVKIKKIEIK